MSYYICVKDCGGGNRTRSYQCYDNIAGCDGLSGQTQTEKCNEEECPPDWTVRLVGPQKDSGTGLVQVFYSNGTDIGTG